MPDATHVAQATQATPERLDAGWSVAGPSQMPAEPPDLGDQRPGEMPILVNGVGPV